MLMCAPSPIPVVTSYGRQNGTTLSLWEAPAHPAEESCLQTLALPPPPQHPAVSHPSRADEPRAPMGHSAEILAEPPPPSGPARVTQEEMMVPGEKQTLPTTSLEGLWPCPEPWGPICLLIWSFPCTYLPYIVLSKKNSGTVRGLGKKA